MAYELNDKVVVITGGARGIGAKVIEYMLEEGAKVSRNMLIKFI